MDCVISCSCYKGTILQRNHREMHGHFPIICSVKFQGKNICEPQDDCVISKQIDVITWCVIKGLHCTVKGN